MRKGVHKLLITVFCILMTGALLTGCSFHNVVNTGTISLARDDAKEFIIEKAVVDPIKSIVIKTGMADVELIEADDFYVEIDYLYWEEEPDYSLENGKLYFDDSHAFPNSYSINFNLENTIKVYLPKASALTDLSINNSSGDVSIAGFVADDMNIGVSYGNLTLEKAAAIKSDITLSSGTSRISDFQAGELDFINSYGNAEFTNINTGDPILPAEVTNHSLDIMMSSGDVSISGLNTDSIEINNSYGDITCKDITAGKFKTELSSGNLEVSKADLQDIDVNDSYGNVILYLTGPDSDYSLDLYTSYGDITVDNQDYDENLILDNGGTRAVSANLSSGDVTITFE